MPRKCSALIDLISIGEYHPRGIVKHPLIELARGNMPPFLIIDESIANRGYSLEVSAERKLLSAIVERAVRDFLGSNETEAESAKNWFFEQNGGSSRDRRFTFSWVCEQLSLDQGSVLGEIARMEDNEEQRAKFPRRVFSVRSLKPMRRSY